MHSTIDAAKENKERKKKYAKRVRRIWNEIILKFLRVA
jgi:hypothetical protein